jgi:hypothetical protein
MIKRVEKLLALGTSPNANEADAAMAKAHELLLKHGLTLADVEQAKQPSLVDSRTDVMHLSRWRNLLAGVVSRALGGDALMLVPPGQGTEEPIGLIRFVGRGDTANGMLRLFLYLSEHIEREALLYAAREQLKSPEERMIDQLLRGYDMTFGGGQRDLSRERQSFEIGMVYRIRDRLKEREDAILAAESWTGTDLVLSQRAVAEEVRRENPDIIEGGIDQVEKYDPASVNRGAQAADNVPLNPELGG